MKRSLRALLLLVGLVGTFASVSYTHLQGLSATVGLGRKR